MTGDSSARSVAATCERVTWVEGLRGGRRRATGRWSRRLAAERAADVRSDQSLHGCGSRKRRRHAPERAWRLFAGRDLRDGLGGAPPTCARASRSP